MACFGGFCPAFRLTSDDELTGVAANQWQRVTNDAAAMHRVFDLAVLTYDCDATPAVVSYSGCHGSGISVAPTLAWVSAGIVDITWPATFTDIHDTTRDFVALDCEIQGHTHGGTTLTNLGRVTISKPNVVRVECWDTSGAAADGRVTIVVSGTFGPVSHYTDYGGDRDKRDCVTERVPYAFTWYQEIGGMFGSAFSQERSGYVHALKLAMARMHAAESRDAERFSCNAMPTLAGDMSAAWCETLDIPFSDSVSGAMRRALLATRLAAAQGPSPDAVDAAVSALLGDNLVEVHRFTFNDLDDPPYPTRWPYGTPGAAGSDIGGGAWYSERCHVFIEVIPPNTNDWAGYRELLDVHLFRLLDTILPAHATFDYGSYTGGGFIIGVSLIGVDAL
jgi:hypothetical protein